MKFRHSPHDFSVDTLPISIGELDRVLRNVQADVGSIYDIVTPILYNMPGFRAGKFWFSMVNVTCTHTGFSYGLLPPPPDKAYPLSGTWHFTFALGPSGYSSNVVPGHISLRGINAIAWGHARSNEFITISTTHYQAEQLNIKYDALTPQWLYELLGPMTKGFAIRNRFYSTDSTYASLYESQDLDMLRSKWHMMPLSNVVRNVPYHLWVFNRHVWSLAPRLISFKHITPVSLHYMCQNVRSIGKLPSVVETEVINQFHESLTDLVQRRDHEEHATTLDQLLYTALVYRDESPIEDYMPWLIRKEAEVEIPSSNYKAHLLKLLYS
jgi:hypothetical protein